VNDPQPLTTLLARDERLEVESWRLHRLLEMRVPVPLAERAARGSLDLHELERLISRGCPPETAVRILT